MGAGLLFGAVRGSRRHPSRSKLRPRLGRAATRRKVQSDSGLFDVSLRLEQRMQFDRMTGRRRFITLLGGAAAWPLAARAQQSAKLPTIGYLGSGTPVTQAQWVAAFVQRLGELGWIDGRTITIEYRWAEGRAERAAEIAAEFVRLKVNVIATSGTAAVAAAMQATSDIPIVFATAGDPVGTGLVASLPRPGGNVTGMSIQQ